MTDSCQINEAKKVGEKEFSQTGKNGNA